MPGYRSTLTGIVDRLEKGTHAQIMLVNIPDVTVVPFLRPVGQKVGPLPIRVVLPDGTDVTKDIEEWTIPNAVAGPGKNGRTEYPPGTMVGLAKLLKKLTSIMDLDNVPFAAAKARLDKQGAVLEENDVLDPDELHQISGRIDEYNQLMADMAAKDPRVKVVDAHGLLNDAAKNGHDLRGNGAPVKLTNTFCGTTDARGDGGFFSFDGVHPSDVGYSIVANELLSTVQKDGLLTQVPAIDEKAVYAQDPHRDGKAYEFVLSGKSVDQLNAMHGGAD